MNAKSLAHLVVCVFVALDGVTICGAESGGRPNPAFRAAVDAVQQAARTNSPSGQADMVELERGFRRLREQFPNEAEVYAELLYVADHSPDARGVPLATQILDWPAPDEVKAKARGVLAKRKALGKVYSLQLKTPDGTRIDLSRLRGQVVLLDFWASWCPPCREELPALKRTYEKFQPRGFEIIGLSFDADPARLRQFVSRENIPWLQHCPAEGWEGDTARRFGITSLPAMWLIDKQGRLRDLEAREGLESRIEKLLAE